MPPWLSACEHTALGPWVQRQQHSFDAPSSRSRSHSQHGGNSSRSRRQPRHCCVMRRQEVLHAAAASPWLRHRWGHRWGGLAVRRRQVPVDRSCHQGEEHDGQLDVSRARQQSSTAHSSGTAVKECELAALVTAHQQQQERGSEQQEQTAGIVATVISTCGVGAPCCTISLEAVTAFSNLCWHTTVAPARPPFLTLMHSPATSSVIVATLVMIRGYPLLPQQ